MITRQTCPSATYRWQLQPEFTFEEATAQVEYLAQLGISHAYLSPILAATPGSRHGYDVIDPAAISPELGGPDGFAQLSRTLREHGLGAIVDIVPNHMAVPTPEYLNAPLWSVLRSGPHSPFAAWFDVDWSAGDQALLMPILGQRIGQVIAAGELSVGTWPGPPDSNSTTDQPVLRYFDHVFPLREGTEGLPLTELIDRQWYRLAHWRVADEELNYRRFFDVGTLAAVRVENPAVFEATHRLLLDRIAAGELDGLRIDHPDGLADPAEYLQRLNQSTGGAWVVVEKILERSETLPGDWACAGTTGYDALQRLGGIFVDPAGAAPLSDLLTEITGDATGIEAHMEAAKREVIASGQYAEVHRLVELLVACCQRQLGLRDHTRGGLLEVVTELLVAMDRYRAYVQPGRQPGATAYEAIATAAERARGRLPEHRHDTLEVVRQLVLGIDPLTGQLADPAQVSELVVRFQQTCGPVMAKGLEDTAFYRWFRLIGLNEVGGNPAHFGVAPEELHDFFGRLQVNWPQSMTTLSTHDTKRSEDVRARLAVISELPTSWAETVRDVRAMLAPQRDRLVDPATEYLLWQTILGTWREGPISSERLAEYATKAIREAKLHTCWTSPDAAYELAILTFVGEMLGHPQAMARMAEFAALTEPAWRAGVLGQKLLQLLAPGVPDVYQGRELVDLSLVDPDNRRPVDYDRRRELLAQLDTPTLPTQPRSLDLEKLLITTQALRLRRDQLEWFVGPKSDYQPIATTTGNAVAFGRGLVGQEPHVVAVATRLALSLADYGGWREHSVTIPPGNWRDTLTDRAHPGGSLALAELLTELPVALLVRQ